MKRPCYQPGKLPYWLLVDQKSGTNFERVEHSKSAIISAAFSVYLETGNGSRWMKMIVIVVVICGGECLCCQDLCHTVPVSICVELWKFNTNILFELVALHISSLSL